MDVHEDSENNVKISDSGYSNSSHNSQSRRSHSSKSTHSGSHSSGSSGYGGKPSTSSSSNDLSPQTKKEKEIKKKKQVESLTTDSRKEGVCRPEDEISGIPSTGEGTTDVFMAPALKNIPMEKDEKNMDEPIQETNCVTDEGVVCTMSMTNVASTNADNQSTMSNYDGFSCVISMHDGVVLYVTSSLTSTLGFPNNMWIGRSFIDFIHPMDRNTFASQITNVLAVPKIVNQIQENAQSIENQESTVVCRIRRYRGLSGCFGVKDTTVAYMPFLLKFRFKHITDDTGTVTYLVVQSIPVFSAFKTSNEVPTSTVSFVIRHNADGNVEYIDSESVPYLGYLPQDINNKNALLLYHPGDLAYLQNVYESIVKDGSVTRSKPFRMMTQNGYYIKVETEWSSFVNPWSKKLEFVTGKHYIVEGPDNPDVFQNPKKVLKLSEEQKNQVQMYRDSIIKIMKEALTKPAEIAKQEINKRCQDVAMFLDFITEEQPKVAEELKLQIQDTDHSYFERDSVMLGGISPHHEYNDSKSSTETPLSYNQLNYNDNLQRYFASHQPNTFVDNNIMTPRNPVVLSTPHLPLSACVSSVMQNSGALAGLTSSGESGGMMIINKDNHELDMERYHHFRLTESLLTKHNAEMEKELMKIHREHRSVSKAEKEKVSSENRQKKKEHLARCNATFQTLAVNNSTVSIYDKSQNLKRMSLQDDSEATVNKRHYLPSCESSRRKEPTSTVGSIEPIPTITTTIAPHWSSNPVNNVNTFILGVGMPPQMPIMNPLPVVQGMFPMYYAPPAASSIAITEASSSIPNIQQNNNNQTQVQLPLAQCMMYGQPIYGSSIVYSPMNPQNPCLQQTVIPQNMYCGNALNPLCLTNSNYEEACRASNMPTNSVSGTRCSKTLAERLQRRVNNNEKSNMDTDSLSQTLTSAPDSVPSGDIKGLGSLRKTETIDRTDGESSYSSFNSSFFKTDSGSAEGSTDIKRPGNAGKIADATDARTNSMPNRMKAPRRKIDPPWMEQVCVTSELLYKYQITPKSLDDVLSADRQKMKLFEQPKLVNEQLEQLYLNLQLEGVAARLTLEEGITSSSSSGEETSNNSKDKKQTREYSKLVMIYEENAPLPSPSEDTSSNPLHNAS